MSYLQIFDQFNVANIYSHVTKVKHVYMYNNAFEQQTNRKDR